MKHTLVIIWTLATLCSVNNACGTSSLNFAQAPRLLGSAVTVLQDEDIRFMHSLPNNRLLTIYKESDQDAVLGYKTTCAIIDLGAGNILRSFEVNTGYDSAIAVSSDNEQLYIGTFPDSGIKAWDIETGELLDTLVLQEPVVDGDDNGDNDITLQQVLYCTINNDHCLIAHNFKTCWIVNLRTGERSKFFDLNNDQDQDQIIRDLAFHDGCLLMLLLHNDSSRIQAFNLTTNAATTILNTESHDNQILRMNIIGDSIIAKRGEDTPSTMVHNLITGETLDQFIAPAEESEDVFHSIQSLGNDHYIFLNENGVRIWSLREDEYWDFLDEAIKMLVVTADKTIITLGEDGAIKRWSFAGDDDISLEAMSLQ